MKNIKIIAGALLPVLWLTAANPVYSQNLNHHAKDNDSIITPRIFQLSLLPFISINQGPANSAVDISLNLLAGLVREVRVIEIGGVLNIDRENAGKCQLAGVGNTVGGSFHGFQVAGVYNITQTMKGCQTGGVINVVKADAGNCQMAGVGNIVGGNLTGLQAAGVFNLTKNVHGVQIAGILNSAQDVSGTQISGLINRASFFKGMQLSVFNFADSCQGIPIGVMSFVRKNGYCKIELSADEIFYSNLAFKTGVPRFYTTFMAGIRPDNFATPLWSYGFGIGTKLEKSGNFSYDLELSSQHISKGNFSDYVSDLHKLYFGIDRKTATKTSIAIGITYNFFITDTDPHHFNGNLSTIAPYTLTNYTCSRNGMNIKTWIGGKIAFRFL